MENQLEVIFGGLGISQYLEAFVEQGFDSWETILDITESDLDALGVKLGHRRKLQRRIANSRGIAPDVALASPTATRMSIEERFEPPRLESVKPVEARDAGVAKRKYRRHPKADENAPERPPSAYVLFSNKMREDLKGRSLTFTEIAKLVGENWQSLTPTEKEPYETQAYQAKEKANNDLTEYKKTVEYRQYNQYLYEFKLKHSSSHPQDKDSQKRAKLEASPQIAVPVSVPQSGSASSSTIGESSSRDGQQSGEPPPSSHRVFGQGTSSVSTTPLSFHPNMDEPLTSPGVHIGGFFELMDDQSPKSYSHDSTRQGHRSRRSTSWKPSESSPRHMSSHSGGFDPSRQIFSHNPPEGSRHMGHMGFMKTHHESGSSGQAPNMAQSQPNIQSPHASTSARTEHFSARSMSSVSGSGTASGSGSSIQGPLSSYSSSPRTPSEPSLPLPIHALLASKNSSRFEPPRASSTLSSGSQQSSSHERALYLHRQGPRRTTSTVPAGGLDFSGSGNDLPSPPQMSGYQPRGHNVRKQDGPGTDNKHQHTSAHGSNNLDGMSALLRAGEIVDRRTR